MPQFIFVRPLRFAGWLAIAYVLMPLSMQGNEAARTLAYTFQRNYAVVVFVTVGEVSSKPAGAVIASQIGVPYQKQTPFYITREQFEKLWSLFKSSGIDQYPIEQARHAIDLDFYYVFIVGERKYAMPKKGASPAAVALAARLQAYATVKAVTIEGAPKPIPSSATQRVIIK